MAQRAYQRQHLALFAAGFINGAGTTRVTFGCQMTRIAAGQYGLVLPADAGLINNETFTFVTVKGIVLRYKAVEDTSNVLKTIFVFSGTPTQIDNDIEVQLYRSVLPA